MEALQRMIAVVTLLLVAASASAGPYSGAFEGIAYDDPRFTGCATGITVTWVDGFDPTGAFDEPDDALGPPPGTSNDVVTLGNNGSAVLTFDVPVRNNPGPDLAVFENGYNDPIFAELAFVEVATDGVNYARFPSVSLTAEHPGEYGTIDATDVYNLAGKHVNNYDQAYRGTPFDLDDLIDDPLVLSGSVDLGNVQYVRIVDVYGHSDGAVTDDATALVDPTTGVAYTTDHVIYDGGNFGGLLEGFDLDAVGILAPAPGDADGDGLVDGADLALWQQHYDPLGLRGTGNTWAMGNWDGDNCIDGADLALWQQNYNPLGWRGKTSLTGTAPLDGAGPPEAVPEPTTCALMLLTATVAVAKRKRRRRASW